MFTQISVGYSPTNIHALSLYSECHDTDSFTPRLASLSFNSFINLTLVSGLKRTQKQGINFYDFEDDVDNHVLVHCT